MSSIFLSHNHKDKAFVRKLAEHLNSHGIRTWVDEAEIRVGDSLITKIESAIKDFTYLGVILSPNSVTSHWVKKEVNMALTQEIDGEQVKVLPLLIEPCNIPGFLSDKLYADFTRDFDDGFETLLKRLTDDLHEESHKSKRALELLQQSYQDWISFSKPDHLLLKSEYIDIILKYIPSTDLSLGLLEFLLSSITLSKIDSAEYLPKITSVLTKSKEFSPKVLSQLFRNPNPKISKGAIDIAEAMDDTNIVQMLINLIDVELVRKLDAPTINALIKLVEKNRLKLHRDLVSEILTKNSQAPDWFSLSYCIQELKLNSCLLIGDGTEFSLELGKMAKDAGFELITLPVINAFALDTIDDNMLKLHKLIILVRGEIFDRDGNHDFYKRLENYIKEGGTLFGTSFVGWETRENRHFTKVLPFKTAAEYDENSKIVCTLTENSPIKGNPATKFSLLATHEHLEPLNDSIIWLRTEETPIFGYKPFGDGFCYYLNICQHWCSGTMPSPFRTNNELSIYFPEVFKWIFEKMKMEE